MLQVVVCQVVTHQGEEQWNLVIQAVAGQINLCSWSLLCIGHIIFFYLCLLSQAVVFVIYDIVPTVCRAC